MRHLRAVFPGKPSLRTTAVILLLYYYYCCCCVGWALDLPATPRVLNTWYTINHVAMHYTRYVAYAVMVSGYIFPVESTE